jgi:CHAT domain-containing protein
VLKLNLAARYVRMGEFDNAQPYLEAALRFYRRYRPADPLRLARAANLMSEVERAHGSIETAQNLLSEAGNIYEREHLSDEPLWLAIRINRGRLAAAGGDYARAEQHFQEVIDRATRLVPEADDALCLAWLNQAILYKSLSRFERADALCRRAFENRRDCLPEGDPELLPYYVALAAIQLDEGKQAEARQTVEAAMAIVKASHMEDSYLSTQLRHQRALVHLLDYQVDGNEADYDAAVRLWEDLGALQEQRHWRLDSAQTLHFLSRIRFLKWRRTMDRAREEGVKTRTVAYQQLRSDYAKKASNYQRDLEAYRGDREKYQDDVRAYDPEGGPYADRNQAYAGLKTRKTNLEATQARLLRWRAELEAKQGSLGRAYEDCTSPKVSLGQADAPTAEAQATLFDQAERLAAEAVRRLAEMGLYPNLHYAALSNRAEILRARAGDDPDLRRQAIEALAPAVELIERPRLAAPGKDLARAEFFARYAAAFDLLVEWLVEDGRPLEALVYAELCRNRTFLDRIRADGVSLSDSLAPADRDLARQEQALLARYAAIAAELERPKPRAPSEPAGDQRRREQSLRSELEELYRQFAETRREICSRSPVYQHVLATALVPAEVRSVVERWVQSPELLVYYYVGPGGSWVFLSGITPGQLKAYRLAAADLDLWGTKHASAATIAAWVQVYVDALRRGDFAAALRRQGSRLLGITNGLFPACLREEIRGLHGRGPRHLTIIPDGSLYRLPLEALVVEAAEPPRFLVDDLSPLAFAYAPSLMILDALKNRPRVGKANTGPVVSLARPDFSNISRASGLVARRYLEMLGADSLGDLPRTEEESAGVLQAFGPQRVKRLYQGTSTEAGLRDALCGGDVACLHLATHGIADQQTTFSGALALTLSQPQQADPANDGFLELPEIYGLPLGQCELVVLSACNTNVGQRRPMEMAATLSRAFLSSGARRVVAGQWPVADQPTAQLMTQFFRNLAACQQQGQPCDYSSALQDARDHVRRSEGGRWGDPRFWAPFVLLGPAD